MKKEIWPFVRAARFEMQLTGFLHKERLTMWRTLGIEESELKALAEVKLKLDDLDKANDH